MSNIRLIWDASESQSKEFARRMRDSGMIPLVVLGFRVEDRGDGGTLINIGSLWGERVEQSASDVERAEFERLLGDLGKLLGKWMEHDQARLD